MCVYVYIYIYVYTYVCIYMCVCIYIYIFIHSFISIQPLRPGWQEPEPSHVTGMALAHCILGKFLRGYFAIAFPRL